MEGSSVERCLWAEGERAGSFVQLAPARERILVALHGAFTLGIGGMAELFTPHRSGGAGTAVPCPARLITSARAEGQAVHIVQPGLLVGQLAYTRPDAAWMSLRAPFFMRLAIASTEPSELKASELMTIVRFIRAFSGLTTAAPGSESASAPRRSPSHEYTFTTPVSEPEANLLPSPETANAEPLMQPSST
eukprot:CAMPEP_0177590972 /NCGR_PEP_ID=MMETSP0419_2-20121207/7718_1 /TAXON_ID=582737 /ORGANISM="Tetraselmis sp., Strain GSL018" /LENGTH=190 /DNA_ID=CAMNT_0019081621 /DNA_START=108 /DNA_END=681 /DNA_ORIENTATION=+